jgi:hypothetical protein
MTLVPEIPNPCFESVMGWLLNKAPLFSKWTSTIGARPLIVLGADTLLKTIMVNSFEGERRWKWKS